MWPRNEAIECAVAFVEHPTKFNGIFTRPRALWEGPRTRCVKGVCESVVVRGLPGGVGCEAFHPSHKHLLEEGQFHLGPLLVGGCRFVPERPVITLPREGVCNLVQLWLSEHIGG